MAIPLHQHSHYSVFDGYATIDEILDRVQQIGSNAVALTDHGTVAGHVEFYRKAIERGINPILGIESYQARDDRRAHHKSDLKGNRPKDDRSHLIILAYNNKGLNNLWTLSTRAYLEGFYHKPRVDWELLSEHNEGLILTSACLGGKVSSAIMEERSPEAVLDQYLNIFGDRFYIELHTYDSDTQRQVNAELVRLGQQKGIPFVYATDAHYACGEQYPNHEAFVDMSMRKKISEHERNHPPSLWILDEAGIRDALSYLPRSVVDESISNTHAIAEMSEVELPMKRKRIPTWGKDGVDKFIALVEDGYKTKVAHLDDGAYMDRIEKEMSAILEADLVDFFLIEHLVNDYANTSGITRGPGRGSVGGSLIAYLLGITDIDPIHYGLIFERFYNKGREKGGLPDIDTDFAIEDRDKIKQFMRDTFGEDCVTHIGTVMKLHGKSAIERVGKYLEVPMRDIEDIKAIIDSTTDAGLMADWDDVIEVGELQGWIAKYPDLFNLAGDLHGRIFASSVHASGFVVGDEPLAAICPLRLDKGGGRKEGEIATQFDMHEIESLGFMKLDFLALKNLSVLKEAQFLIERNHNVDWDFKSLHHDWRLSDEKFWDLLDRGLTVGVFQVEDGGIAKKIASKMRCRSIEDLAVLVALNRPGPLRAGYVDMYLDRREAGGEFDVLDPFIRNIVADTYGVFVYQEQVISLFTKMGFSLEEADDVRRIMGKKKVKEMEEFYPNYMEKATQHMSEKTANELWQELLGFSKYAFNKAHSVAYGIITLWTLWTKYLYAAEYLLACIRKEDTRDDIPRFIAEAQRMGIKVNAPDINKSLYETDIIDGEIYLGLKDIKGVSKGAEWVIENRPFDNFDHMIELLEEQNKQFLKDKKEGKVDGPSPKQRIGANKAKALFNAGAFDATEDRQISKRERREFEKELLGIILTNDAPKILDKYKDAIDEECVPYSNLRDNGTHIVAGEIKSVRVVKTKKGQDMAWVTMEYGDQTTEFAAFEQQLGAFSGILQECTPVLACLKVTNRGINLVNLEELT